MDRSLHECGIEGKGALQAFWQLSVKVPTIQLQQAAIEIREEYQRIVVSVDLWHSPRTQVLKPICTTTAYLLHLSIDRSPLTCRHDIMATNFFVYPVDPFLLEFGIYM